MLDDRIVGDERWLDNDGPIPLPRIRAFAIEQKAVGAQQCGGVAAVLPLLNRHRNDLRAGVDHDLDRVGDEVLVLQGNPTAHLLFDRRIEIGGLLLGEHRLIILAIRLIHRSPGCNVRRQRHPAGALEHHFDRLRAMEVEQHRAVIGLLRDRGVNARSEIDHVAVAGAFGVAEEGAPLTHAFALVEGCADARFSSPSLELGWNDLGVVEHQHVARPEQIGQFDDMSVRNPVILDHEQASTVTRPRRPPSRNETPASTRPTPSSGGGSSGPGLGSPGWPNAVDSIVCQRSFQTYAPPPGQTGRAPQASSWTLTGSSSGKSRRHSLRMGRFAHDCRRSRSR